MDVLADDSQGPEAKLFQVSTFSLFPSLSLSLPCLFSLSHTLFISAIIEFPTCDCLSHTYSQIELSPLTVHSFCMLVLPKRQKIGLRFYGGNWNTLLVLKLPSGREGSIYRSCLSSVSVLDNFLKQLFVCLC